MLGLTPLLNALSWMLSTRLVRSARTGGQLIGARWITNRRAATFRLALGISATILAVGLSPPFVSSLRGDRSVGRAQLAAAHGYNVNVTDMTLSPGSVRDMPGVRRLVPYVNGIDRSGNEVVIVFASCRTLNDIVRIQACATSPQWINTEKGDLPPGYVSDLRFPLHIPGSDRKIKKRPQTSVFLPIGDSYLAGIRLDGHDAVAVEPSGYLVNLADSRTAFERFQQMLATAAPTAYLGNDYTDLIRQSRMYLGYLQFLQVAIGFSLSGLFVGTVVAALRSVRERQAHSQVLGVLGAGVRDRVYAHVVSQALPLLLCTTLSILTSIAIWRCLASIDESTALSREAYVSLVALPYIAVVVLVVVTLPVSVVGTPRGRSRTHLELWS